jgi:hypothetical protein
MVSRAAQKAPKHMRLLLAYHDTTKRDSIMDPFFCAPQKYITKCKHAGVKLSNAAARIDKEGLLLVYNMLH